MTFSGISNTWLCFLHWIGWKQQSFLSCADVISAKEGMQIKALELSEWGEAVLSDC